ncbi:hypothetical protein T06_12007 [Trichinella sp. T6]|nr:hypothetical protein T06_12007 [Trichinella sp. T6]KRX44058.1 hypothetical protein T09_6208 [Trichinella sp. T9]KRX44987.1 hypothetical protein T09_11939 [Trichinella sp. T9]
MGAGCTPIPAFNVACAVSDIYANRGRLKIAFILAIYKAY